MEFEKDARVAIQLLHHLIRGGSALPDRKKSSSLESHKLPISNKHKMTTVIFPPATSDILRTNRLGLGSNSICKDSFCTNAFTWAVPE